MRRALITGNLATFALLQGGSIEAARVHLSGRQRRSVVPHDECSACPDIAQSWLPALRRRSCSFSLKRYEIPNRDPYEYEACLAEARLHRGRVSHSSRDRG